MLKIKDKILCWREYSARDCFAVDAFKTLKKHVKWQLHLYFRATLFISVSTSFVGRGTDEINHAKFKPDLLNSFAVLCIIYQNDWFVNY